jgi:hypothetical protein
LSAPADRSPPSVAAPPGRSAPPAGVLLRDGGRGPPHMSATAVPSPLLVAAAFLPSVAPGPPSSGARGLTGLFAVLRWDAIGALTARWFGRPVWSWRRWCCHLGGGGSLHSFSIAIAEASCCVLHRFALTLFAVASQVDWLLKPRRKPCLASARPTMVALLP